jgi:hypothetical protein
MTVTKKPDRRGERGISRKPSRAGMSGESGCNRGDYARMLIFILHARLRVRLAPGIPHALLGEGCTHNSGASRRENVDAHLEISVVLRKALPFIADLW